MQGIQTRLGGLGLCGVTATEVEDMDRMLGGLQCGPDDLEDASQKLSSVRLDSGAPGPGAGGHRAAAMGVRAASTVPTSSTSHRGSGRGSGRGGGGRGGGEWHPQPFQQQEQSQSLRQGKSRAAGGGEWSPLRRRGHVPKGG
ncbi:unnamed protein product, partial [Discosporangium mesarthrocarpum]